MIITNIKIYPSIFDQVSYMWVDRP